MWYPERVKCPRWLSDVRSVEARTGWPRPLCKRFVAQATRRNAVREIVFWAVLIISVQLLWAVVTFRVIVGLGDALPRQWPQLLVASKLLILAGLFTLLFRSRRTKVYRELAEFRRAPWCLKCRYPAPETTPICPECGERIPPEIAKLAAGRAER